MAKNKTNYFSHDSKARYDTKIINLRIKHGAAGYGVFFMILERLREEDDYKSVKDYNTLAFDFRVDASLVKSVVEDFGLFAFTEDGKCFYSDSFCNRMNMMDEIRVKRSKAAERRWKKQSETAVPGDSVARQDAPQAEGEQHPVLGGSVAEPHQQAPRPRVAAQADIQADKEPVSVPRDSVARLISGNKANAKCLEKFFSKQSRANLDVVMMQFGMKPQDVGNLRKLAEAVVAEWNLAEATHQDYKDWASHLISTMRIKHQSKKATDTADSVGGLTQPATYDYDGGFGSKDV